MYDNDTITSLCVSLEREKERPLLYRIADVNEHEGLTPFELDRNQDTRGMNTCYIHCQDKFLRPKGIFGFWTWYSPDGKKQYVESLDRTRNWIEYRCLDSIFNWNDLRKALQEGISIEGDLDHSYLFPFSQNGEISMCAYCESANFHKRNDRVVLRNDVYKLGIYEIYRHDIVSFDSSVYAQCGLNVKLQYYANSSLPSHAKILWVNTPEETIRRAMLTRINRCTEDLPKSDASIIKEFLRKPDFGNIIDQIVVVLDCSRDEAEKRYCEFREKCELHFIDNDFTMEIVQKLINYDPDIYAKFEQAAYEKWKVENTSQIHEADAKYMAAMKRQKNLDIEIATLEKKRNEAAKKIQTAEDVATKVQERITDAKLDISNFLAEYLFYTPLDGASETSRREQISFICGKNVSDAPETITENEVLDDLADNLEIVGVDKQHAKALGSYLLAAYFTKIPLIIAGFGAEAIMDALSATLFNKTAYRFYATSDAFGTADAPDGIIIAYDAFGEMNKILDLVEGTKSYVCFISQTSEELEIEPRSLFNYALPLFMEYFITGPTRSSDLTGTIFKGKKFEPVDSINNSAKIPKSVLPTLCVKRTNNLIGTAKKLHEITDVEVFKLSAIPIMLALQKRDKLHELVSNSNLSDGEKKEIFALIGEPR